MIVRNLHQRLMRKAESRVAMPMPITNEAINMPHSVGIKDARTKKPNRKAFRDRYRDRESAVDIGKPNPE